MAMLAVDNHAGAHPALRMGKKRSLIRTIIIMYTVSYGATEVLERYVFRHSTNKLANQQHAETPIVHSGIEAESRLACASVDNRYEVGRHDDTVFTSQVVIVLTNDLTLYDFHVCCLMTSLKDEGVRCFGNWD